MIHTHDAECAAFCSAALPPERVHAYQWAKAAVNADVCPADAGTGSCDCASGEWIKRLQERSGR